MPQGEEPVELARVRRQAADAIERLLELLDAIDGECDLEPSIGGDDREEDYEIEQTDCC